LTALLKRVLVRRPDFVVASDAVSVYAKAYETSNYSSVFAEFVTLVKKAVSVGMLSPFKF
jgi:hypothetical protein